MAVDTVIAGGTLATASGTFEGSVAIDDETIVAVGAESSLPSGRDRIDASGRIVMPGVVDPHVHAADPFSADPYETATAAAALGGVTTVLDFAWQPYDSPESPWDYDGTLTEAIEGKRSLETEARIDFGLHGGIEREDPAVFEEFDDLIEQGVTSFKMFTAYDEALSNGFIYQVFEELAARDAVAVLHTEENSICEMLTARYAAEHPHDPTWYPKSRPGYAEAMAAADVVRLATEVGTKYYGVHTSCGEAADVIASHQDDGSQIRAETCTQYTVLDDSLYEDVGALAKIAPPLRSPQDRDAMFEALSDGPLSVVSTDHVAIDHEAKRTDDWSTVGFGMNSLQVSLPVFHDEAVGRRNFSYPFLVSVMCTNPARTFGLPRKGTLEPGTDADIVIFDPDVTWTIDEEDIVSTAGYSLYDGREVTGRVDRTYVRGTCVAANGELREEPGYGKYIARDLPDWSQ
ncbi:MAG: amidohydrolase family protein [Halobacteriales archaeon]|nr:amidohydrolase family protein [Halobacteriales archaeon]